MHMTVLRDEQGRHYCTIVALASHAGVFTALLSSLPTGRDKKIYRFCKALASIVIIWSKKFLQKSVDYPSNIQPISSLIDLKVSHIVKIMFFQALLLLK